MAVSYPLSLPTVTGIRNVHIRSINSVNYSRSPLTFEGQVQANAGQMWAADVSLPPMKRANAAVWVAWLTSLRGQYGTFLMGDPLCATAQGSARGTDIVTVNGAGQTGETLNITSNQLSATDYLKAGDYIQLGSAATATLHKVLEDVNTDASGNAALSLWPHIRTAPANGAAVTVENTVGRWRLDSNQSEWSVNEEAIYGMRFSATEAI